MESEGIGGCASSTVYVPDTEQETAEMMALNPMNDRRRVMSAGPCQSQLMVRMPFSDEPQPISPVQLRVRGLQIRRILIEEGRLMIALGPGPIT